MLVLLLVLPDVYPELALEVDLPTINYLPLMIIQTAFQLMQSVMLCYIAIQKIALEQPSMLLVNLVLHVSNYFSSKEFLGSSGRILLGESALNLCMNNA
jgi:hypothetical protein